MAATLNKKFVIILGVGLAAVLGGTAFLYFKYVDKSPEELVRLGEQKIAAGDIIAGEIDLGKAVNKAPNNPVYLRKWRDALLQLKPKTQTAYEDRFDRNYVQMLSRLAEIESGNPKTQVEFLDTLYRQITENPFNRNAYVYLATQADQAMERLKYANVTTPEAAAVARYRGLPIGWVFVQGGEVKDDEVAKAFTDLEAALKADPADWQAAWMLTMAYYQRADLAASKGDNENAKTLREKASGAATAFAAANPQHAAALLGLLQNKIDQERMALASQNLSDDAGFQKQREITARLRGELDTITQAMMKEVETGKLDLLLLTRFERTEEMLSPQTPKTEEIIRAALAKQPDNSDLLLRLSAMLSDRREMAESNQQLDKLLALPDKPLSWPGLKLFVHRPEALRRQVINNVRQAELLSAQANELRTKGDTAGADAKKKERQELLDKAKEGRAKIADLVPSDSPALLLLDGELAAANSDWLTAKTKLAEYATASKDSDAEALLRLAVAHQTLNEPGEARRRLERVMQLRPGMGQAVVMLAEVEYQLQNKARSVQLYDALLRADPTNEALKKRRDELAAAANPANAEGVSDPVLKDLLKLNEKYTSKDGKEPDTAGAMAELEQLSVKHKYDPRVVMELVRLCVTRSERPRAVAMLDKAIAADVNTKTYSMLKQALALEDPIESQLKIIELSEGTTEFQRLQASFELVMNAGKLDRAKAYFEQAVAKYPEEAWTLEQRFLRALQDKNFNEAAKVTELASSKDVDRFQGKTFQARLLGAQGREKDAVLVLEQVIAKGAPPPEIWRLLGRMQVGASRPVEAVTSFKEALKMRPDSATARDLMQILVALNRRAEALEVARNAEKFAGGDTAFLDAMLDLEAIEGDKKKAMEIRERLAKARPDDRLNLIKLVSVYIEMRDNDSWAKARTLIDSLRKDPTDMDGAMLEARWFAKQAKMADAKRVIAQYFAALPSAKVTEDRYLTFAQFLFNESDNTGARIILLQGRRVQDPKTMRIDKAMSDLAIQLARWDAAVPSLRAVVAAGADTPEQTYRKRLAEALVRTSQPAEARKEIDALGKDAVEKDPVTTLLLAEAAGAMGDKPLQRATLDKAVKSFANEPMVYVKRAQVMMTDPSQYREAEADLQAAIKVRAGFWQAHRMLSELYRLMGRTDDSLQQFILAVDANPRMDEMRLLAMQRLIEAGREGDAVDMADKAIRDRPSDLSLWIGLGDTFAVNGRFARAQKYYRGPFEQTKNAAAAGKYLDALLRATPPQLTDAEAALRLMPSEMVESNPAMVMTRARVHMARNRVNEAKADAVKAFRLIAKDQNQLMEAWLGDLRLLYESRDVRLRLVNELITAIPDQRDWLGLFRVAITAEGSTANLQESLKVLETSLSGMQIPTVRRLMWGQWFNTLYQLAQYEQAVEVGKRSLAEFKDDGQMCNNIAYTLAKHLNKLNDAIPYAEQAVAANPNQPEFIDTLGFLEFRAGQVDKAENTLLRGRELAQANPVASLQIAIHLAMIEVSRKNKAAAQSYMSEIERFEKSNPKQVSDASRADIEELRKQISAL